MIKYIFLIVFVLLGMVGVADAQTVCQIFQGCTGSSTAVGARSNLGLIIGTNIQAFDSELSDIASTTATKGDLITSGGADWLDFVVGTDGQLLMASSTASNGISWETVAGGSDTALDAIGDPTASSSIEIGNTWLTIGSAIASSTFEIQGSTGWVGVATRLVPDTYDGAF